MIEEDAKSIVDCTFVFVFAFAMMKKMPDQC